MCVISELIFKSGVFLCQEGSIEDHFHISIGTFHPLLWKGAKTPEKSQVFNQTRNGVNKKPNVLFACVFLVSKTWEGEGGKKINQKTNQQMLVFVLHIHTPYTN